MSVHFRHRVRSGKKYYYAQIAEGGAKRQVGLGRDYRRARRAYLALLDELAEVPGLCVTRTVADLVEEYRAREMPKKARSTQAREHVVLDALVRYLGFRPIQSLRPADFTSLMDSIAAEPLPPKTQPLRRNREGQEGGRRADRRSRISARRRSPATLNRFADVISRVFRWAVEQEYLRESPCRLKRRRQARSRLRYLDEAEERRLLAHAERAAPDLTPMILVLLNTGLRLGEAVHLRWEDVDLLQRRISIARHPEDGWQPKSRQLRVIPLNATALRALASLPRRGPYIFHAGACSTAYHRIGRRLNGLLKAAGIFGATVHSLRHTFGTRLAQAGVPVTEIQRLLGHSSLTTTEIYMHVAPGRLDEAVGRLDTRAEKNAYSQTADIA